MIEGENGQNNLNRDRSNSSWLALSGSNRFAIFTRATDNISYYNLDNGDMLRKVMVKISLERIDI